MSTKIKTMMRKIQNICSIKTLLTSLTYSYWGRSQARSKNGVFVRFIPFKFSQFLRIINVPSTTTISKASEGIKPSVSLAFSLSRLPRCLSVYSTRYSRKQISCYVATTKSCIGLLRSKTCGSTLSSFEAFRLSPKECNVPSLAVLGGLIQKFKSWHPVSAYFYGESLAGPSRSYQASTKTKKGEYSSLASCYTLLSWRKGITGSITRLDIDSKRKRWCS